MNDILNEALSVTIRNWEAMGKADYDQSESAAELFEHSFYRFVDIFRDWVNELSPRPASVEALLALDVCREIAERLPDPLLLNFETEAELIIDGQLRVEEEKYD